MDLTRRIEAVEASLHKIESVLHQVLPRALRVSTTGKETYRQIRQGQAVPTWAAAIASQLDSVSKEFGVSKSRSRET